MIRRPPTSTPIKSSAASDVYKRQIQGVIDGIIVNGKNGEIIDYKTDRVANEDELLNRYNEQMRIYKMAALQCFGLENVNVTLYSFNLSKEISVKL